MISMKKKKGFSLAELTFAIAIIGVITTLVVILVCNSGVNDTTLAAKQARLETVLATATQSIVSDDSLTVQTACNPQRMKDLYKEKIATAQDTDDVPVNGTNAPALKIPGYGTIAFQASTDCVANWYENDNNNVQAAAVAENAAVEEAAENIEEDNVAENVVEEDDTPNNAANSVKTVAIYAILDENETAINVPASVTATNDLTDAAYSANTLAFAVSSKGLESNYSNLVASAPKLAKATLGSKSNVSATASDTTLAHDESICANPSRFPQSYSNAETGCNATIQFYEKFNSASCTTSLCQGNGYDSNGQIQAIGKINLYCKKTEGSNSQCGCPNSKIYWANYSFNLTNAAGNPITGACLENCEAYGLTTSGTSCICDGTWDAEKRKCLKEDECPETYQKWDTDTQSCVCKTVSELGADYFKDCETYDSSKVNDGCKRLKENWEMVDGECVCPSPLTIVDTTNCECVAPRSMQSGVCKCDKSKVTLTGEEVISDNYASCKFDCWSIGKIANSSQTACIDKPDCGCLKKYTPATGSGTSRVAGQCICDSTQAQSTTCINSDEKYDETSSICKSCKSANRKYDGTGACVCKSKSDLTFAEKQIYNTAEENCIYDCKDGAVANSDHTECTGDCLEEYNYSTEKLNCVQNPSDELVQECLKNKKDYISNPSDPSCMKQCSENHIADNKHKACVCDSSIKSSLKNNELYREDSSTCIYTCKDGAVANSDHTECIGDCLEDYNYTSETLNCATNPSSDRIKECLNNTNYVSKPSNENCIEECGNNHVPNSEHTQCVCNSPDKITYTDSNYKYDSSAPNCESLCDNPTITQRSSSNPSTCECRSTKPGGYYADAGYHYDSAAGVANKCQSACPTGDYCPGASSDPNDPNPTPDSKYSGGDVFKCLCGYVGSGTGNTTAKCNSKCPAGKNCPAGTVTPQSCPANKICLEGVCEAQSCNAPTVPNSEATTCVCASSKPNGYNADAGSHYDATAGVANKCQSACPAGDYCPGATKDKDDPNPIPDTSCTNCSGGDVFKCLCGYVGSGTGNTTAKCNGKCPAGKNCPAGTVTPQSCPANKICREGVCEAQSCDSPLVPNSTSTACICPAESAITVNPGFYFNANDTANSCQTACPTTAAEMKAWVDAHGKYFTTESSVFDATQENCTGSCPPNHKANSDRLSCECGITKADCQAGTHFDSTNCACVSCPAGNYCPGQEKDENPSPVINAHYPQGDVIKCPCGSYGATEGLKTYTCTGKCQKGYYCDLGSTSPKQDACTAGYECPEEGMCNARKCEVPKTSSSPFTSCDVCLSQEEIKKQNPDFFGLNEEWVDDADKNCKQCKSNMVKDSSGVCHCPADAIYWDAEQGKCVPCPKGSYCSETTKDPCPCGTYGNNTNLKSESECTTCTAGNYCPEGSMQQTACVAGQECPNNNMCTPASCTFPSTSASPYTSCNKCLTEKAIKQQQADYFQTNEIWTDNVNTGCKTCKSNMVRDGQAICHCPADAIYWDAEQGKCVPCPKGSYCSETTKDPCPCGTYGNSTNLKSKSECTACTAGNYCPEGSTQQTACVAGQECPNNNMCTPASCTFPATSASPYTSCNKCQTEEAIKQQQKDYFNENEIWKDDITAGCKTCKSNMEYNDEQTCACPATIPYWNDDTEECQKCKVLNKLYFARQASKASECTLHDYLNGTTGKCFDYERIVPDDMKAASEALSDDDKVRTFKDVYAYVVSYNASKNEAKVVGVFTARSWYATFENDYDSTNTEKEKLDLQGNCSEMCANNAECTETCTYFNGSTTTMFNSCSYAVNNEEYLGKTINNSADELCKGGDITLQDGCKYSVGGVLRKVTSPLVLDLENNGFSYTSVDNGVIFDLDNDGTAEKTAWTKEQTTFDNAFLVLDKNKNGQIDNGGELFGDQNGSENGFIELAKYDDNGDGKINKKDKAYTELRLWVDFNKNAKVDYAADGSTKELKTLEEAGVKELSVEYTVQKNKSGNVLTDAFGNITGFIGSFTMMVKDAAGKLVEAVRTMMDVFFVTK